MTLQRYIRNTYYCIYNKPILYNKLQSSKDIIYIKNTNSFQYTNPYNFLYIIHNIYDTKIIYKTRILYNINKILYTSILDIVSINTIDSIIHNPYYYHKIYYNNNEKIYISYTV